MTQPTVPEDRALYADVIGGVTTFFTMAYIVVVNPAILSTPGTGMPFTGALTATVLVASSMTLLMGLYARLPFAVAPGMGLNAFFAFTIVLQNKVPWQTALGSVARADRTSGAHRASSAIARTVSTFSTSSGCTATPNVRGSSAALEC
jgi:hypothetical protein